MKFPYVDPQMVQWLGEIFPDRLPRDFSDLNPAEMARRFGQQEVIRLLRNRADAQARKDMRS